MPICDNTDGTAANPTQCTCGNAVCTSGQTCKDNICSDVPVYDNMDGTVANGDLCECGSINCGAGFFCDTTHQDTCTETSPYDDEYYMVDAEPCSADSTSVCWDVEVRGVHH